MFRIAFSHFSQAWKKRAILATASDGIISSNEFPSSLDATIDLCSVSLTANIDSRDKPWRASELLMVAYAGEISNISMSPARSEVETALSLTLICSRVKSAVA